MIVLKWLFFVAKLMYHFLFIPIVKLAAGTKVNLIYFPPLPRLTNSQDKHDLQSTISQYHNQNNRTSLQYRQLDNCLKLNPQAVTLLAYNCK